MAKFTDALKATLQTVAPTLATALGGPLAGAAVHELTKKLGKDGATLEEIEPLIVNGPPEVLMQVKQAEQDFQKFLTEADIKLVALDNEDRASARAREIALRDWAPTTLAISIVVGFFGVILWLLKWDLPVRGEQALLLMLGALNAGFVAILNYFFGSSAGSARKQNTIDTAMKGR